MSLFTFPVISNRPKTWSNLVSTPTVHCFSLLLVTFWTPTWRSGLGLPSLNISYDIASLPASSNIFGYHWYTKSSCCSLPRTEKKYKHIVSYFFICWGKGFPGQSACVLHELWDALIPHPAPFADLRLPSGLGARIALSIFASWFHNPAYPLDQNQKDPTGYFS